MAYQAGSAYSTYGLDIDGLRRGVAEGKRLLRELQQEAAKLKAPAFPGTAPRGGGGSAPGAGGAREAQQLAQAQLRASLAAANHAGKVRILSAELAKAGQGTAQYYNLLTQKTRAEQAAERASTSYVSKLFDVKGALLGTVGAFGIASLATTAFQSVVSKAKEGLALKRDLEQTSLALAGFVGSQRRANDILAQANQFGQRYGFTQREIGDAVQSSARLIRESKTPVDQILAVETRLLQLNPAKNIDEAARAIGELKAGQVESIVRIFNLSRESANRLNAEVKSGKDVFVALDTALASLGVTNASLENRTKGLAGAEREHAQASEQLGLALARLVQGPGGAYIRWQAQVERGATVVTNAVADSFSQADKADQAGAAIARSATSYDAYLQRVAQANALIPIYIQHIGILTREQYSQIQAQQQAEQQQGRVKDAQTLAAEAAKAYTDTIRTSATEDLVAAAKSEELKAAKERLAEQARLTANQLYATGAATDEAGVQALIASGKIDELKAAYLRLRIAAGGAGKELEGPQSQIGKGFAPVGVPTGKQSKQSVDQEALLEFEKRQRAEAKALADAQRENAYAAATTAGKYAILRSELARLTPGTVEYVKKQGEIAATRRQLASEQEAAAKRAGTTARKDATAAEREAKAQEKADLSLLDTTDRLAAEREKLAKLNPASVEYKQTLKEIKDLESKIADEKERQVKSAIDARLAVIEDRKDRRKEERELAQARRVLASGSTSAAQRAAAQDVLERVPLEQLKRQQDIARQVREAGGVPVPTGPGVPAIGPGGRALPAGAVAAATPQGAAQAAVGALIGALNVRVLVDGKEIAAVIEADVQSGVVANLRGGLAAARSAGAGH